jgi:hypothetical protein
MNPISQTSPLPPLPDTHLVAPLVQPPRVNDVAGADADLKVAPVCTDPAPIKDVEILEIPATCHPSETSGVSVVNSSNAGPKDEALLIAALLGEWV